MTALEEFAATLPYALDEFQVDACTAVEDGRGVLVAAPTGAGKTVVGEFAVELALRTGRKAFYTTPIKALSNQKYHELVARHGGERVGLLTGDVSIRGEAPVVVMTTEVLRNMVYAGSATLAGLGFVVMDEVHYLADRERGAVWEELIIQLPESVAIAALSATVSNVEEFGAWMATVRGDTQIVLEEHRPVPLWQQVMANNRLFDLFVDDAQRQVNPELQRLARDGMRPPKRHSLDRPGRGGKRPRPARTPSRVDVVDRLEASDLLPAIYFIFSRAGTEDAVRLLANSGIRLTSPDERHRIARVVEERCSVIPEADLLAVGFGDFSDALQRGIAAHHAGMLPLFKEVVEELFQEALLKVVFATETLALGINMPARSVVIEKLTKYNGDTHEFLTPAQFTQLTGRAGRRGIDDQGTAVVLWSPFVTFTQIARLVASREFPLTSAFRPTYNMAANLVHRYDRDDAHAVLARSFAQFQADRAAVTLQTRLDRIRSELDLLGGPPDGDADRAVADYVAALDTLAATTPRPQDRRERIGASLAALSPGDVVSVPHRDPGRPEQPLLVLSVAFRKGGAVRVHTVAANGADKELTARDLASPVWPIARVDLPVPFEPGRSAYRRDAAAALRRTNLRGARGRAAKGRRRHDDHLDDVEPAVLEAHLAARAALEAHPLHDDDDRDAVVARHRERARLAHDLEVARRRLARRGSGLVNRFDAVLEVLARSGRTSGWSLTDSGERLRRIYHECDLLIVECVRLGLLDDLDPPAMAAMVSCFTYEHRSPDAPPPPTHPSPELRRRFKRLEQIHSRLNGWERAARVPETRAPDAGFAATAHRWAAGRPLAAVLDDDLTGGDFVRNTKQLIDLMRQLGEVAADPRTAAVCRRAADSLFRGVVEAGSTVSSGGSDVAPGGGS